ncbi:MAG: histidine phosphatase family protein [Chlamydiales bacterium]|nr:histidine phosphatase family protein [Chlamydiales bacterium]
MQLIAIRHAKTKWNYLKLLQGRKDISIIYPEGEELEKIKENKNFIDQLKPFDKVYTSSLKRTKETAYLHGFSPRDLDEDNRMDELDFGENLEGIHRKNIQELWEKALEYPEETIFGESLLDFEQRIVSFLKSLQDHERILLFGHGVWIRAILSKLEYGNLKCLHKFPVDNLSYTEINVDKSTLQTG